MVQTSRERSLVTKIPGQDDVANACFPTTKHLENSRRRIAAAVVHKQQLPLHVERVERLRDLFTGVRKHLCLIKNWHDNAKGRPRFRAWCNGVRKGQQGLNESRVLWRSCWRRSGLQVGVHQRALGETKVLRFSVVCFPVIKQFNWALL